MNNLVIYHNDFNQLKIPISTELEQNLLMGILVKIKNSQNEIIEIYPNELRNFFEKNLTDKEIATIASLLRQNFFKTDFTFLIKDEKRNLYGKETINLFNSYKIFFHDQSFTQFSHLELKINETFKYLVDELTKDFTEFELLEFIGINGKYAKTLYRLLKQFKNTGNLSIFKYGWQNFCDIMQIPNNYTQSKIDEKILKPAIKELSAEPNLFTNEKQTIFKNLTYKKIKDPKGRGRGGKVIGIEFYFTPEPKRNELKEMIQNLARTEKEMEKNSGRETKFHILTGEEVTELTPYISQHFSIKNQEYGGYDTCKIKDLKYIDRDNKKMIWGLMINQENHKEFEMFFDSIAHMKNALKLD
ncbi:replication initiation protein [Campylobacter porcelli]|uniref:Plasmid replication protein n=1 Tax=Campylobacter porcelli TaxID=1660073 RepID=A0A1X9SZ09_9BACT|nr:replication initiation protein [Campylobacter sp. RM6137]ARR01443.1 plasmid replication protein [Campylobacter sp. RM6137]